MNDFINYLNSTNNVGGNSTGSLAEAQVKSPYYDSVKVDRALGSYITECVKTGNHHAFILTGHAGDGKTSILVQVLKSLGYLKDGSGLQVEETFDDFFYVKDMSEISSDLQVKALTKALSAPHTNKTSLLISNTGPLLKSFETLKKQQKKRQGEAFNEEDRIQLQSTLLSQLDSNKDTILSICGYSFILVNIARVDNVVFAAKILKKIIAPNLWSACNSCPVANSCPMKNNRELVANQFDRVSVFVENYYRYLYENDKRMTIRQMVGQLSYAITGNLTCNDILHGKLRAPLFNYNFANLFFGFTGLRTGKDALQISGIKQIQDLGLDCISLDVDYRLFVNQDYSCFVPQIQELIQDLYKKYKKHYQVVDEERALQEKHQEKELQLRRAIRRFYLMFSLVEDKAEIEGIMNQIYGTLYSVFHSLISSKQSKVVLNKLRNTIFEALYIKNTGFLPNGKTELPLTLRREDDVFQNVMIVLGEVRCSDLCVLQKSAVSKFEDVETRYDLVLQLEETEYKLTLPMINYFEDLINGAISSNSNPALSHGIAKLDAILLDQFRDDPPESEEDCELTVIINTSEGQETERFAFDGNLLSLM